VRAARLAGWLTATYNTVPSLPVPTYLKCSLCSFLLLPSLLLCPSPPVNQWCLQGLGHMYAGVVTRAAAAQQLQSVNNCGKSCLVFQGGSDALMASINFKSALCSTHWRRPRGA
jgi:hypothetical protein